MNTSSKSPVEVAEEKFKEMLPALIEEHNEEWIYVNDEGEHGFGQTKDAAEIAALDIGHIEGTFVVRYISILEYRDEEDLPLR